MNRPSEVIFSPNQVVTIAFNGTDTVYQPRGYVKSFHKDKPGSSETISFVASCVDPSYDLSSLYLDFDQLTAICPELRIFTDIQQDIISDSYYGPSITNRKLLFDEDVPNPLCRIIEGPRTSATDVYEKIAKGVVSIIGSIINGKNVINMTGHSRGGIVPSEVAHELYRIKEAMGANPHESDNDKLISLICGDPNEKNIEPDDVKIRNALKVIISKLANGLESAALNRLLTTIRDKFAFRDEYKSYCNEVWVECLVAVDPVSGNTVLNAPCVGWVSKRMFKYSPIIRNVYVLRCTNEDTAGFDSTHLTYTVAHTKVKEYLLPGHHGTLTGNEFGNNGEPLDVILKDYAKITAPEELAKYDGLHTRDAQHMALFIMLEHLHAHGTVFIPEANHTYPLKDQYNPYIAALNTPDSGKTKELIQYECYQEIMRNYKAYQLLNHTVYISFLWPWHESFKEGQRCHETKKTRQVMLSHNYDKTSLGELFPFRSKAFKNWHNLQLFMKIKLGINPSFAPEKQLTNLLRFSEDLQSKLEDEESAIQKVQDAIQTIVLSLVSTYITNNLDIARKQEIIRVIRQTLQITIPNDAMHYSLNNEEAVANSVDSVVDVQNQRLTNLGLLKRSLIDTLNERIFQQIAEKVTEQKDNLRKLITDIQKARNPEAEKIRVAEEMASHRSTDGNEEKEEAKDNQQEAQQLQELRANSERDLIKAMLENSLPSLINRYFEILEFTTHLRDLSKGLEAPEVVVEELDEHNEDREPHEQASRIPLLKQFITDKANELNAHAIDQIGENIKNEITNYVEYHRQILRRLVYEIRLTATWQQSIDESGQAFQERKANAVKEIIKDINKRYFELKESIQNLRRLRNNPLYTAGLEEEQAQKIEDLKAYLREEVESLYGQLKDLPHRVSDAVAETDATELLNELESSDGGIQDFYQATKDAYIFSTGGVRDLESANAKLSATRKVTNNFQAAAFKPSYSFHILNGFILALGIAAVAIACAILITQPLAAAAAPAAIIGVAGLCTTGLGLYQNRKAGIRTGQLEVCNTIDLNLQH